MRSANLRSGASWTTALVLPVVILAAALAVPVGAVEPLPVGATFPEDAETLVLTDADGVEVPARSLWREHGLLVVFTANTCPYSIDWRDRLPRLAGLGDELKVGLMVVNSNARKRHTDDSPEAMQAEKEAHFPGLAYHVDAESKLADLLGATRTPEVFLFDGDKKLVYHGLIDDLSGPVDQVEHHFLRDAMRGMVDGGPMPEATVPVGCAILRPRKRRPAGAF